MSYLDLLPEEPIPIPDIGLSDVQKKGICLTQHTCARCGKEFYLRWGATGYRRSIHGRPLLFCTWKCLREDEKVRKKPKRGRPARSGAELIAEYNRKNREDQALLEAGNAGEMDKAERRRIRSRIAERMKKIKEIESDEAENE